MEGNLNEKSKDQLIQKIQQLEQNLESLKAEKSILVQENLRRKEFFDQAPTAMWEEDITELIEYLEELKKNGVTDFEKYFAEYPSELFKCIKKIKLLDINQATINLHNCESKEYLMQNLDKIFTEKSFTAFKNEIIAIASGHKSYSTETNALTFTNEIVDLKLYLEIVEHTNNGHKQFFALVSTIDTTRLKTAESEIFNYEQSLKAIFNASNDIIMLVDKNGRVLESNETLLKLLNIRKLDLLGRDISSFVNNDFHNRRMEIISNVIISQKPEYCQEEMFGRTWETSYYPVYGKDNIITSIAIYQKDITKILRSTDKLQESEERLKLVLKAAKLGWWDYDFNSGKGIKSNYWSEMLGYDSKNIESFQNFFISLIHPDDIENVLKSIRLHDNGITEHYDYELRLLCADGNYRWIYNWGQVIKRTPEGKPLRSIGVHMDITDRKNAEATEQMLLNSYAGIIDNAIDAIYILDKDAKFIMVNESAEKMYGYNKEFFVGKTPAFLSAEGKNDFEQVLEFIERAFNGEQIEFDFWGKRKNGNEFPKIVRLNKVNYMGKEAVVAFGLDITERYNSEQKLRESEERYRTIFNQVPLSITQIDSQGNIIDINNFHTEHISKGKKNNTDFIGTNVLERETIKIAGITEQYKKLLEGHSFDISEILFPKTTGEIEGYFNLKGVPLYSNSLQIGALITAEDVTKEVNESHRLNETESKLSLALEGATVAFWDHDLITDKVYRSKQWFEMLGYTENDLSNDIKTWYNLIHPDDIEKVMTGIATHRNGFSDKIYIEHRLRNSEGVYQWILNWGKIIERDDYGVPLKAAGIHMDISARKIAEIKLMESENKYRNLFESQPSAIIVYDFSEVKIKIDAIRESHLLKDFMDENHNEIAKISSLAKVVEYNKETLKIFEVETDHELVKDISSYFNNPSVLQVAKEVAINLANNNFVYNSNPTTIKIGNHLKHLYLKLIVPKDYENTFKRVIVTLIDITELTNSKNKLYEEQQKYSTLVENANEGILIVQDLKIVFCNKYFCERVDSTYEEIVNSPIDKYLADESLNMVKEYHLKRLAKDKLPNNYEAIGLDIHANKIPIEINASTISYNGKPAIQLVVRDITERKEAETLLKETKQQLQFALEGSEAGLWDWYVQTGECIFSEGWAKLIGYKLKELSPLNINTWITYTHPDDQEISNNLLKEYFEGKSNSYVSESRMKHKSGEWVWVLDKGKVVEWDSDGKPIRMVGTHLDITEQKKSEQIIKENEAYIQSIFASAPIGIGVVKNRILVNVNDTFCAMLNYTREELIGINSRELYLTDEEYLRVGDIKYRQIESNGTGSVETKMKTKDGKVLEVYLSSTPIDSQDQTQGITFSALDITESKIAENKLKESEKKFRSLFENMNEGIFYQSNDNKLIDINDSCLEIFGIEKEDFLSRTPFDPIWYVVDTNLNRLEPEQLPQMIALKNGKEILNVELGFRNLSTNEFRWLIVNSIPQFNFGDEKPFQVFVTMHEITERKKVETSLKLTTDQLELAIKGGNFGIFSWDLRTDEIQIDKRLLNTLGYTKREIGTINTKALKKYTHPVDLEKTMAILNSGFSESQHTQETEIRVRNNKGNWFYYLVRGKAIEWDKDGKPLHITGTHLDITNRITTESLLRSSEKKYRSLYDNALIALFRTNLKDRKVIQANKVAAKIFGYSSIKEFIDKFDIGQAFVNQNDEEHVTQLLREKGYIEKLVIHSKRKDGSFIWNETSFLVDAEKGYVDCFAIDNTSRILAEKKLKETNEKLRNLYRYMNNVREEERKNIAREVHDNLGQKLTALNLDISWIQQSIPENCEELKYQFLPILDLINQSIITVQRISTELRPGILDDLGLINAIQWQSNEFSRRTNLNFKLNLGKEEIELEDEIKTQLFRVYQESLTNIIRHSDAKNIYVNLLFKKRKLIFEIIDDGKGISMNKINDSSSFGLIGMKERIASINGEFEISNRLRKGTKVRILVPLEEDK